MAKQNGTEQIQLCSQCKENPRANPGGNNPWCTQCNTRYQKERQVLAMSRVEAEGWVKGREALRRLLVEKLCEAGAGMMRANEVAVWIASVPGPNPPVLEEEPA